MGAGGGPLYTMCCIQCAIIQSNDARYPPGMVSGMTTLPPGHHFGVIGRMFSYPPRLSGASLKSAGIDQGESGVFAGICGYLRAFVHFFSFSFHFPLDKWGQWTYIITMASGPNEHHPNEESWII